MNRQTRSRVATFVGAMVATMVGLPLVALAASTPLVEFLFEQNLTNSGSLGGNGRFVTNGVVAPAFTGADVGIGGGYAMDNTSAIMNGAGGYVRLDDDNRLDGLKSLTIAFWYKTTNSLFYGPRLANKRNNLAGFEAYVSSEKTWQLFGGDGAIYKTPGSTANDQYGYRTKWVFFAATWNIANGIARFYAASQEEDLAFVNQVTATGLESLALANTAHLAIGANQTGGSAFSGLIDNLRIWGSTNDASGVLSEAEIRDLFIEDNGGPLESPASVPLVEMLFDNTLTNSGAIGGTASWVTNYGVFPVFTADGLGASGFPGDYAMDNNSATNMKVRAGYCSLPDSYHLDGLKSLTVAFWYKTTNTLIYGPRMVTRRDLSGLGFEVYAGGAKAFHFYASDIPGHYPIVSSGDNDQYGQLDKWVFAAATWDAPNRDVRFYVGTKDGPLSLVSQPMPDALTDFGITNASPLVIGAGSRVDYGSSAFDGWIDNVRLWGSQNDSSGALSMEALEVWFKADHRRSRGTVIILR
ncbi:MAG: LamG domain-containing protein [Kiritimatiellae bacterium]|nr:LamG domain-containing protein [Kiritimatiellia bacterium]